MINRAFETYELEKLQWSFFATSHGKGAVDGVGGSIKRLVHREVLGRKIEVQCTKDFVRAIQNVGERCSVKVVEVLPEKIENSKAFLNCRWEGIKTLPGTQSVHHVEAVSSYTVRWALTSGSAEQLFCFDNARGGDVVQGHINTTAEMIDEQNDPIEGGFPPIASTSENESSEKTISKGDFVLVKFASKRSAKFYVAIINEVDKCEVNAQFMRKQKPSQTTFAIKEGDTAWVDMTDCAVLPMPDIDARSKYIFPNAIADAE